jgi:N-ethylmaleimide reductase
MNPSSPMRPVATNRAAADHWLALGADLITFGRASITKPDLVERLRLDLPIAHDD